jgi:hypothetical protein
LPRAFRKISLTKSSLISTALEAQDATSVALQDDDALHYLNAMLKLLKEVKAPKKEIAKLERLYESRTIREHRGWTSR